MNYVAIDTSGKHLTLIVKKGESIYEYFDSDCGVHHSVRVMEELEKLLVKADFKPADADFYAVCVGAGSFTGIRIGLSTAKAMAFATNKPLLGITSFDTAAYNTDRKKVLSIIDAGHNGYYVCAYVDKKAEKAEFVKGEDLARFTGYRFVSGEKINGVNTAVVSVKDGLIKAVEDKSDLASNDINAVSPLYLRKSQAEEGR